MSYQIAYGHLTTKSHKILPQQLQKLMAVSLFSHLGPSIWPRYPQDIRHYTKERWWHRGKEHLLSKAKLSMIEHGQHVVRWPLCASHCAPPQRFLSPCKSIRPSLRHHDTHRVRCPAVFQHRSAQRNPSITVDLEVDFWHGLAGDQVVEWCVVWWLHTVTESAL